MKQDLIIRKNGAAFTVSCDEQEVQVQLLDRGPLSSSTCSLLARSYQIIAQFHISCYKKKSNAQLSLIQLFSNKGWLVKQINTDPETILPYNNGE